MRRGVSMLMGKGAPDSAERIIGTCTFTLCAISLALTLIMQLFAVPILRLFGASDATLPYALEYISIYSLGTIFVQLSLGLNAFITAQGFSTTSMFTVTIGSGAQHRARPAVHVRVRHGRARRGARNDPLAGRFVRVGRAFPLLGKIYAAAAREEPSAGHEAPSPLSRAPGSRRSSCRSRKTSSR